MIHINLLKEEGPKKAKERMYLTMYLASVVSVAFACLVFARNQSSKVTDLETAKAKLEQILVTLRRDTKDIEEIEKHKQELRNRLITIARLRKSQSGPVQVLDHLNNSLPERSWLSEIVETDTGMRIIGKALDNTTTSELIRSLEESDFFGDVKLEVSKQSEDRGVKIYEFAIDTKVYFEGEELAKKAQLLAQASSEPNNKDKKA
jgi:type IV pilus assembly protein PilN